VGGLLSFWGIFDEHWVAPYGWMHERLDADVAVKALNVDYALAFGWMWNVRGRNDAMRIETSEKLNSFALISNAGVKEWYFVLCNCFAYNPHCHKRHDSPV
jgi:hypothetical protein